MWNFGNLKKEDWQKIKEKLDENDLLSLKKIHDENNLSDRVFGCCDLDDLKKWFEWGIRKNIQK
jgi:hypothetical protein